MHHVTRRARVGLFLLAAALPVGGGTAVTFGSTTPALVASSRSGVDYAPGPYDASTTTTTTASATAETADDAPTTTSTAAGSATTTTTRQLIAAPTTTPTTPALARDVVTTPCSWTVDVWPAMDEDGSSLDLHVSVPAHPNRTIEVAVFPHGSATSLGVTSELTNDSGDADLYMQIPNEHVGTEVDIVASLSESTGSAAVAACDPKPYTVTLVPSE